MLAVGFATGSSFKMKMKSFNRRRLRCCFMCTASEEQEDWSEHRFQANTLHKHLRLSLGYEIYSSKNIKIQIIFSKFYARLNRSFPRKKLLLERKFSSRQSKMLLFPRRDRRWRLKLHHRCIMNWVSLFLSTPKPMMAFYNLLSHNKRFFLATSTSRLLRMRKTTRSIFTRIIIKGEFRSDPPASLMPQGSSAERRDNVTPNSWYNWLIMSLRTFCNSN